MKPKVISLIVPLFIASVVDATELNRSAMNAFVTDMAHRHGFVKEELTTFLGQVKLIPKILSSIAKPAEHKPWYSYRAIFMTDERILAGKRFYQENLPILSAVSKKYGVPPEIIVAIIGVETFYGRQTGGYRVADALATLAFNYPRRAAFFRGELEHFLLMTREQRMDPLTVMGSYAGAMGLPQFMPSSYRSFAVDFDQDGVSNLISNKSDVIASVANYFHAHGWESGNPIATRAYIRDNAALRYKTSELKPPVHETATLQTAGVIFEAPTVGKHSASLMGFEQPDNLEFWVTYKNFYVITRYNHSPLYAMAVYQLAQSILTSSKG